VAHQHDADDSEKRRGGREKAGLVATNVGRHGCYCAQYNWPNAELRVTVCAWCMQVCVV
jgi:hypothetical protein